MFANIDESTEALLDEGLKLPAGYETEFELADLCADTLTKTKAPATDKSGSIRPTRRAINLI